MRYSLISFIPALFFAALPIVGCSGDDKNPNPTSGGGTITLSDFEAKAKEATCASAVECFRFETKEECLAATAFDAAGIQQYIDDGTVVFHGDKADACIDAFAAFGECSITGFYSGSGIDQLETACGAVIEGTIADGATCAISEQCVSKHCEQVDVNCMDACCASKCAPETKDPALPKIGEPCPAYKCEVDAYCQFNQMGMPTTCAAAVDLGKPCTNPGQCKLPSFCELDVMTMMGTCKSPIAHGGACDPMKFVPCDELSDHCDPMTKVCATKPLPGASCADVSCVEYAFCDDAAMKCVKDLGAGAACTDMSDCQGDLNCVMGKCAFDAPVKCP